MNSQSLYRKKIVDFFEVVVVDPCIRVKFAVGSLIRFTLSAKLVAVLSRRLQICTTAPTGNALASPSSASARRVAFSCAASATRTPVVSGSANVTPQSMVGTALSGIYSAPGSSAGSTHRKYQKPSSTEWSTATSTPVSYTTPSSHKRAV